MTNRSRRAAVGLAAVASASLVMAGVANSAMAATPAPGGNAACPAAAGVTPTSVTIGWIGPKTGAAAANYIGSSEAAQLRVDQENAKGGVNGRKIILKVYDDGSNGSTQVTSAQKAIQQDQVFGLTAQTNTTSMYQTLKDQGIPVTGFSNPAFGTDRNAFGTTGATTSSNPAITSTATLEKLKSMGVTKLANINHVSTGASASGNATAGLVQFIPGMSQVLRIADSPQGAHDATSEALRIKNSGADGLIYVGFIDGGVSIAQALKQQGVNLKGMSIVGLSDPAVLKTTAGALDGALGTNYGTVPIGVKTRAVTLFSNAMKAAGLNPYSSAAPQGYVGADLLIAGLKAAGKCPTRDLFINNLRKVTKWNGNGLVPQDVNFAASGIMPNGNPNTCTWFMIAKGTDLVPDAKPDCTAKYIDTSTGKVLLGG